MPYAKFQPRAALRPFVEGIWVQEDDDRRTRRAHPPTRVLPTGTPELVLYFGDPFVRLGPAGPSAEPRLGFSGQRTRAIEVEATGRTGVLIVRFHPWGAAPLLATPMPELQDRFLPFDQLASHRGVRALEQQALDATSARDRVDVVERFLVRWLADAHIDPFAVRVARTIKRSRPGTAMHAVAEHVGVTRRHLNRRFRAAVGMGPKRFAGLLRFQESIHLRRHGMDWADIACLGGYSDQAHLIRQWKAFTGESPARGLDTRPVRPLGTFFHDDRRLSHFHNTTYL